MVYGRLFSSVIDKRNIKGVQDHPGVRKIKKINDRNYSKMFKMAPGVKFKKNKNSLYI